jgi:hypothetical protein
VLVGWMARHPILASLPLAVLFALAAILVLLTRPVPRPREVWLVLAAGRCCGCSPCTPAWICSPAARVIGVSVLLVSGAHRVGLWSRQRSQLPDDLTT